MAVMAIVIGVTVGVMTRMDLVMVGVRAGATAVMGGGAVGMRIAAGVMVGEEAAAVTRIGEETAAAGGETASAVVAVGRH